jgi:hypothetical protein
MQILFVLSDFDEVKQLVSTEICRHGLAWFNRTSGSELYRSLSGLARIISFRKCIQACCHLSLRDSWRQFWWCLDNMQNCNENNHDVINLDVAFMRQMFTKNLGKLVWWSLKFGDPEGFSGLQST